MATAREFGQKYTKRVLRVGRWIGRETVWAARDGAARPLVPVLLAASVLWLWLGRGTPSRMFTALHTWLTGVLAPLHVPVTAATVRTAVGALAVALVLTAAIGAAMPDKDKAKAKDAPTTNLRVTRAAVNALLIVCVGLLVLVQAVRPVAVIVGVWALLAVATARQRGRDRIRHRLRTGVAVSTSSAVDEIGLSKARWHGRDLASIRVRWPESWRASVETRREQLVDAVVWELCGPPPETPAQHVTRAEYVMTWRHAERWLIVTQAPRLPLRLDATAELLHHPDGIVLGQTTAGPGVPEIGGVPVALYVPNEHLLISGRTQFGKSTAARWMLVSGLMGGHFPAGCVLLDCKGSGSFAPLIGREGVHLVGHHPSEWRQGIDFVLTQVRTRYAALLAWRSGQSSTRPDLSRGVLVIDEVQRLGLAEELDELARLALESGWVIWCITQRPDAKDALPGPVKEQLDGRISSGPLSGTGARMVYDSLPGYERAMTTLPIKGRAMTYLGGTWRPVQFPYLPMPVEQASAEAFYPPRARQAAASAPAQPADELATVRQRREQPAPVEQTPTVPAAAASGEQTVPPKPASGLYQPPERKKKRS